jgi:glycosyltransferase involved in cell wall biosynthesis
MRLLLIATLGDTLRAFYLPMATHLRKAGWQVDGLAHDIMSCTKCRDAFDRVWETPLSRNPLDPRNLTTAARAIAHVVRSNDYDLVHVCTPIAAFVTRFALRRLRQRGKPRVVYTSHGFHFHPGGNPLVNSVYLAAERLAGRWTDCLAVINEHDRKMAERYSLVPPARLAYIPGAGLDLSRFDAGAVSQASVAQIRQELGLEPGAALFLMIAEFNDNKRQEDALHALAAMRRCTARLAFAGHGPTFERAQRLSVRLRIDDRVHFLGVRRDIPPLIRASVATILPSRREGLPRCVMESLALAVPVIASDIRGARDLLDGGCGLLVRPGDVDGFARAMDWIMDHPAEAREMGLAGRIRMAKYDIQRIVAIHEALYQRLLPAVHAQPN